jgi:hypothetical protein
MNGKGLKAKLSEELIATVMREISEGCSYVNACQMSGLDESTFHKWKKEGDLILKQLEEAENKGKFKIALTKREKFLIQFVQSLVLARAKGISRNLKRINNAADSQWQAAAWLLERMDPENFGRKDKHELAHTGNITGSLSLAAREIEKMSADERLAYANTLRKKMNILEASSDDREDSFRLGIVENSLPTEKKGL